LLLLLLCATAWGCGSIQDPQLVYNSLSDKISRGELQTASIETERAYHLYSPHSPEWGWRFRILKAQILITQSRAKEALAELDGELPLSLVSSDVAVRKVVFEGLAYRIKEDFSEAQKRIARGELLANTSQPALLSEVLNARGSLEFDQQNYSAAEATFRRALASAKQYNLARQQLASLGNLARVAISNRRFAEAIDQSRSALRIARSAGMGSIEAALLGNLGWCYFQLGDFVNAVDYFKQAKEASERLRITGNSFYWEENAAQSYEELHEYAPANEILRRTLENATKIDNKQTMTETLNSLVRLDLITGQLEDADSYSTQARNIEDAGLEHLGILETRYLGGRIATLKGDFAGAEKLLHEVMDKSASADSLKWEAEAGLARMYDAQASEAAADREYRKSIEMFEASRSAIERDDLRISFLARGIESYEAYIDFLLRRERVLDALKIADQSRSRTLAEGLGTTTKPAAVSRKDVQPEQLARRLKATLLFYWLGENHSYLWVITPGKTTCLTLPAASKIDPLVKTYREGVAGSNDVAETEKAVGEGLYAILVAPAQKFIEQNSRVILLPDGSLYSLNFETLIVPEPKPHFWIEDVTLTTASSLSLLASAASRPPAKQKSLLLVGDALKASDEFEQLPQAEDEMKIVGGYFPESSRTILKREQATPGAYLASNPERYAYLHFVTHGTASRAQPLESAVILSKDPASDTYKLYARDIVTRHLNAELVTISACNGSGTRAYSGEGLVGLSWAFVRAGAHNVIAALWEVSNAPSTAQLMDAFYKGLSRGEDPATALREAKLSFLRSSNANSVFKKPYYWAPFQLYSGS
jgi:CHAT domain-containing protein/tetratricopeptide (TPR) repeat protein